MITQWETIDSKKVANLHIFDAYLKSRINPDTGNIGNFTVLESSDWVNIIPITNDNKIIMIEQYRHGTDEVTLEIPGGLIELNELPINAAKRECNEETGFGSTSEPIFTGVSNPNPAFLNNKCFSFVWQNCLKTNEQKLDMHEIINIHEFTRDEVKNKIISGEINHSIILTAFFFYSLKFGF